jgi:hypothetical protein
VVATAPASKDVAGPPPPELAATLDLFLEMPILEHMEKLQNFERIRTVDLDRGEPAVDGQG